MTNLKCFQSDFDFGGRAFSIVGVEPVEPDAVVGMPHAGELTGSEMTCGRFALPARKMCPRLAADRGPPKIARATVNGLP